MGVGNLLKPEPMAPNIDAAEEIRIDVASCHDE
jgi:hypothetical protein